MPPTAIAIRQAQTSCEVADRDAIVLDDEIAKGSTVRGVAYMHMGEVDRAIADYDKVVEFSPSYGDAYYNRAIAHRAKGDLEKAIADYTKAIENNARDVDAFRLRGDAYRSKGDFVRAVTDYSTALAFNPDDTTLYNSRALTHVSRGDYIAAIADATKAATLGLMTPAATKPTTAQTNGNQASCS